jgi:hypothetical protein
MGCHHDGKRVWREINNILYRVAHPKLPPSPSMQQLADEFAVFFTSKVQGLCQHFTTETTVHTFLPPCEQSLQSTFPSFNQVCSAQIKQTILSSPNKSSKHDILPTRILKQFIDVLLPAITIIVNRIIACGMPTCYKHAFVRPLLKKPNLDVRDLNNYRPVSNLSFLSKVVEKIVLAQLCDYLESNSLLDVMQSAYRKQHSCETALTLVSSTILRAMDNGMITPLVMLDLSAAFDTVEHSRLLNKLESAGITGDALNWLRVYLSDRSQSVVINDEVSSPSQLLTGVPQGSVLGPVLFSMYVSDLSNLLSRHDIGHMSYADDLQIFSPTLPSELVPTMDRLERCILEVREWLNNNHLVINEKKTEFIIFGTKRQLSKVPPLNLHVGEFLISQSDTIRNLGVHFDPLLTFECHIKKVCQTAYFFLRYISNARRTMDSKALKLVIDALVMSRIEYCASLMIGLSSKLTKRVNRVIKHCDKLTRGNTSLSFEQRSTRRLLMITHTTLKSARPHYLWCLLKLADNPSLRSFSNRKLCLVHVRTEIGKRSFEAAAPLNWNALPDELRCTTSGVRFRLMLTQHLAPDR